MMARCQVTVGTAGWRSDCGAGHVFQRGSPGSQGCGQPDEIAAMTRKTISFDTVREIGLTLPGVEEGTTYGSPALKIGGKMFACLAVHKSAEPNSLVLRIAFDDRDELISADPDT